jgi:toxin CcdB
MAQFAVYRNPNPDTRRRFPLLLDIQSPLLDSLATCVVVPLAPLGRQAPTPIARLMPVLEIGSARYVMVSPQLAGVPRQALGPVAGDASAQRTAIVAALDLLFTGV